MRAIAIDNSPCPSTGNKLQPGVDQPQPTSVSKSGVEVSHLAQFGNDPTLVHEPLIVGQLFRREVARDKRLEDRFGGEHATLDRGVNSFQTLRVEKTGAVAREQHTVGISARHCKVTAGGDRLRAVTDHLAAFEQFCQVRMGLKKLKLGVWIDQWIFVVESGDVTEAQHAILQTVNQAATVRLRDRRKTERVCNEAGLIAIVRQLPQIFQADAIKLRIASLIESQTFDQLLRQ